MTKRSDYKLSPRMGVYLQSLATLESMRAHPAYGSGELIDAAADAAFALHAAAVGQNRRKAVSRAVQHTMQISVLDRVATFADNQQAFPEVATSGAYTVLNEAFVAAASSTAADERHTGMYHE